jgi:hypothetical protein
LLAAKSSGVPCAQAASVDAAKAVSKIVLTIRIVPCDGTRAATDIAINCIKGSEKRQAGALDMLTVTEMTLWSDSGHSRPIYSPLIAL